jgi:predicted transcriptional regulator
VNRNETAKAIPKLRAKIQPGAVRPQGMGYDPQGSILPNMRGPPSRPSSSAGKAVLRNEPSRSALKTRLDILEAVRDEGPSNRFKIVTMANLSPKGSMRYLGELVSLGLLMENQGSAPRSYALTAKGLDFLNRVKEAEALVAAYGLVL